MIFVDPSELREGSLLGDLDHTNIQQLEGLEMWTGADLMISASPFPATTEVLVREHIRAGAILVQRKSGLDLPHSIGERMGSSISRMREAGARQPQCVLLFIGVLTCNAQNFAIIDGRNTQIDFWSVQGAISKWHDRGGVFESISRSSLLVGWLNMKLRHLTEYVKTPVKDFWPPKPDVTDNNNPLQFPQTVSDGRITLATLPGIGPVRAKAIWSYLGPDASLANALCLLTNPHSKLVEEVGGIGKKTIENIRAYMKIDEIMWLSMDVLEELK